LHGELFEVAEKQLEQLLYACEYHHQGITSDDPTIGTCFDADRLDLPRVGIWPEPQYMSTEAGRLWKYPPDLAGFWNGRFRH
jgi:uncharacterized protein